MPAGRPRKQNVSKGAKNFRSMLLSAELDNEGAAELLGCSERTVRGYADGSRKVPEIVMRFLKAAIVYDIELDALLKPLPPKESG